MEIKDIKKVEEHIGTASTVKADEFVPVYAERIGKFLRDNQQSMGDEWVNKVSSRLYDGFKGKNEQGDILGSSVDIGVAVATFCPEFPLITGQQLLRLYSKAGEKNPFGEVYVDFGVNLNGDPRTNPEQAKILLQEMKKRGIEIREGRVPNFSQLRLIPNQETGLAYRLAEDVSSDDVALVSDFPFKYTSKNGLFGAFLGRYGSWDAYVVSWLFPTTAAGWFVMTPKASSQKNQLLT
jgi:hypothetical protein